MSKPVRRLDDDSALGLFVGAAVGLSISIAVLSIDSVDRWVDDRSPLPEWSGVPFAVLGIAVALAWSLRRRERLALAVTLALIPLAVGGNAVRLIDPNPEWAELLRGIGLVLMLTVVLSAGLILARRLRELERLLLTEATSAAFFLTLIAAGAYGVLQGFFDLPRLSLVWVPIFGLPCWVICWALFERRLS